MKLLVFSDSHGRTSPMLDLIRAEQPDAVIHLGDGRADLEPLFWEWPELKLFSVPGNCDGWTGEPAQRLVELEGMRFLLCHGHSYRVKSGLGGLLEEAKRLEVQCALYGHTHVAHREQVEGIWLFNPGSVGAYRAEYGVIEVQNGVVTCENKRMD